MGSFSMGLYRLNIRSGQSRSCDPPLGHLDATRMKLKLPAPSLVSVDANRKIALDAARPLVALYLAEFPNVARESGIPADVVNHIAAVHRREGSQAAAELVTDAIVTDLTCAGTIAEVQEGLARRRGAGVESADCQPRTEQHGVLARATGPVTGWDARYSVLPNLVLDLSQETLHRLGREPIRPGQNMGVGVERGRGQGVPEHGRDRRDREAHPRSGAMRRRGACRRSGTPSAALRRTR